VRFERGHTRRGARRGRGAAVRAAVSVVGLLVWGASARAEEPPQAPVAPEAPHPLEPPVVPDLPPAPAAAPEPTPPPPAPPPAAPRAAPLAPATPAVRAPEPVVVPPPPRARPRMSAALGMGVSIDDSGLMSTKGIPSFFATGGVGVDWPVGFDLGAFSSAAQGRYPGTAIDRLALDAFGVLRPFAWRVSAADPRYRARLVRATGLELGLGVERDGTTTNASARLGLRTGVRFEAPLGLPGYASELRLRVAARYLVGFSTPRVQNVDVGNSVELYAALVSVF
jgi:hypothetical protein